jgi:DNA-binding NarL/FixJ family response regulator/signal transduction histidine kinase
VRRGRRPQDRSPDGVGGALLPIAVLSVLGYRPSPIGLPLAVLVYTVGTRYRLAASAPVLALLAAVLVVSYRTFRDPVPPSDPASVIASLVGSWVLGASIRRRRDELARQAVAAERLRIARELHDVVAHSMSVVAVQSGVALHLLDADPERARASLVIIAASSRRGLDEMRRLLQVLRPDAASGEPSPVPGLADLPALAADMKAAGLAVRLDMEGVPEDPPPAVALTAYRIVQEALTNTLRHAGAGSSAHVRVRYGPDDVEVDVLDDGRGSAALPSAGAGGRAGGHAGAGRPLRRHPRRRAPTGRWLVRGRPAAPRQGVPMIRVAIADDQALVRAGFRALVDTAPGMEVVGEASDGAQAVELVARTLPDVVRMDVRMPVMNRLEATRRIAQEHETVKVLVLTTFNADEYVYEALRVGASGFLLKDAMPDELLAGIRIVASGDALLSPRATRLLVEHFTRQARRVPAAPDRLRSLTDRERHVLRLIAQGLSNPEICAELVVSAATVKTHVGHLLTKLEARDRAQLVVIAYTSGFMAASP